MITWRSGWMWLVVFVVLGVGTGIGFSKYRDVVRTNGIAKSNLQENSNFTVEACRLFFDKPIDTDFALRGTLLKKGDSDLLIRFNEEESMWISLREGYKVGQRRGNVVEEKDLGDVKIGADVTVRGLGFSNRLENLIYADLVQIN